MPIHKIGIQKANIWQMIPIVLGNQLSVIFDETVTTMVLNSIGEDLGRAPTEVQWLATIYFIGNSACSIPLSRIGDRFGYLKILRIYLIIGFVSQLCTSLIQNFYAILVFRFITGCVYAGVQSTRNILYSNLPPPENRQVFVSATMIIQNIGGIFIPIIGGAVVQYVHWNWIFLICAIMCALFFGCSFFYQDFNKLDVEQLGQEGREVALVDVKLKFDWIGTGLFVLVAGCFCLFFTMITTNDYVTIGLSAGFFAVFLGLLVYVEFKHPNPIISPKIFYKPTLFYVLFFCIMYFTNTGYNWMTPQLLYTQFDQTEVFMGIITAFQATACMLQSALTTYLLKKVTPSAWLTTSFVSSIVCFCIEILTVNFQESVYVMYVLTYFFLAIQMTMLFALLMTSVSSEDASIVAGVASSAATVGQSVSLCVVTSVQKLTFDSTNNIYSSYSAVLGVLTGMQALAMVMGFFTLDFNCRKKTDVDDNLIAGNEDI